MGTLHQGMERECNTNLNMIVHTMMLHVQVLTIHISSAVYLLSVFDSNFSVGSVAKATQNKLQLYSAEVTLTLTLMHRILMISGLGDDPLVLFGIQQEVYLLRKLVENGSLCFSSLWKKNLFGATNVSFHIRS